MTVYWNHPKGVSMGRLLQAARPLLAGCRMKIGYSDAGGAETEREVDPLGLGFRSGAWLLAAHCHLRGEFRHFRLDRIKWAKPLRQDVDTSLAPEGFSPRAFSEAGLRADAAAPAFRFTIQLRSPAAEVSQVLLPSALLEFPEPDVRLCHLRASDLKAVVDLVMSLGGSADLLHPAEGRVMLREARSAMFSRPPGGERYWP